MSEKDVKVVNTSDADMVGAFQTPDVTAVVTWNPMVSEIVKMPGGAPRSSTARRSPARSST